MAQFRICPDSGFYFDKNAESLMKANAVAGAASHWNPVAAAVQKPSRRTWFAGVASPTSASQYSVPSFATPTWLADTKLSRLGVGGSC